MMSTDTELLVYEIFHLIRFILNLIIFFTALIFLMGGCFHHQFRSSKQQWFIFNICIGIMIFAIINAIFAMLPFAPTYLTIIAVQVCTLQHFLEDVVQGQVAYSLIAFSIHQIGPQEWKNRSLIWFGICISIQWICSYLLPLPQILMSNISICFGYIPKEFFSIYSLIFLFILPICFHLILYLIFILFKQNQIRNIQIHPLEYNHPIEILSHILMKYILIMTLLFAIIGYGPKGILIIIDLQLKQSIAIYSVLEILPSICLLINIGLFYKIHKDIRKKITSICRC